MILGESGRLRRLTIGPETLIGLLTQRAIWHLDGVPEGVQVVDCGYDHTSRAFYLTLEHESFEPVPEGQWIPQLFAGITVHYARMTEEAFSN